MLRVRITGLWDWLKQFQGSQTWNLVSAETMKMQPRILPLSLRKLRVSVRMTTILVGVGYFHSRSFAFGTV
jgi:hypothetical protein